MAEVHAADLEPAVLTAYVKAISHQRPHDNDIAGMLHRGEHVAAAHHDTQQMSEYRATVKHRRQPRPGHPDELSPR